MDTGRVLGVHETSASTEATHIIFVVIAVLYTATDA